MKVSVIIVSHNSEKTISRAIRSALHQEGMPRTDYEIIVVDNGSEDLTAKIVGSAFDGQLQLIALRNNQGLPAALNKGIINSAGMFIARLDDDDFYRPKFLAIMTEFLETNKEFDWVSCEANIIDDNENKVGRTDRELACCILFRRHVLESVGLYNEKFWQNETQDILTRIMQDPRYKDRGAHIKFPLYNWYQRVDSLTQGGAKGGT